MVFLAFHALCSLAFWGHFFASKTTTAIQTCSRSGGSLSHNVRFVENDFGRWRCSLLDFSGSQWMCHFRRSFVFLASWSHSNRGSFGPLDVGLVWWIAIRYWRSMRNYTNPCTWIQAFRIGPHRIGSFSGSFRNVARLAFVVCNVAIQSQ